MRLSTLLRMARRVAGSPLRLLLITTMGVIVLPALNVLVHTHLHVCPLNVARFDRNAIVPVVYGRPMGDALYKAARGEIVLGGCLVGPTAGVCPHCHWPAAFRNNSDVEPGPEGRQGAASPSFTRASW